MIPDDQVEEVRLRADIVDVISEFVPLKKSGKDYKARCPFHEERTPSFYVVPDKGFYNCFGCGESGDVFSFLMKRGGMEFVDAVKHVAARSGVEITEVRRGEGEEEDPNRPLYEALSFARSFFEERLADPEEGVDARDYLSSRGFDEETVERFGLGWAPDDWRALRDAAATHGFDDRVLMEAGLLNTSEKAPEPYDRFRGRVMIPIEDLSGRTVAFGGRVLGKGEGGAKYINSPETPVFHKGGILYGLSRAKNAIRREGGALVVEGYMDVIALAAAGFEHGVAPLGTSLTDEHAVLLARYTRRAWLLFDSDRAGLRATFRAGDALLAEGVRPSVVTLPPGEDPDTLVRSGGRAALQEQLDRAVDVVDRKLSILEERGFFSSIDGTRKAVDKLLPTLRATADPALRDIYVSAVAERTGVRRDTLERELSRGRSRPDGTRGSGRGGGGRSGASPARPGTAAPGGSAAPMGAERSLLRILVRDRERRQERLESVLMHLGAGDFTDAAYRAIFQALLDDPELDRPPDTMDPVAARRLDALLDDPEELVHAEQQFLASLGRMRQAALDRAVDQVQRALDLAGEEDKEDLVRRKAELLREKREIGLDWSHTARRFRAGSGDSN